MHENDILAVPEREFVRLNALHLSSFFPKVLLPLQFTYPDKTRPGNGTMLLRPRTARIRAQK